MFRSREGAVPRPPRPGFRLRHWFLFFDIFFYFFLNHFGAWEGQYYNIHELPNQKIISKIIWSTWIISIVFFFWYGNIQRRASVFTFVYFSKRVFIYLFVLYQQAKWRKASNKTRKWKRMIGGSRHKKLKPLWAIMIQLYCGCLVIININNNNNKKTNQNLFENIQKKQNDISLNIYKRVSGIWIYIFNNS